MVDDVTLPGAGSVVASDDIGSGRQAQFIKVLNGTDGSATAWAMGAAASTAAMPVVGPNDEFVTVSVDVTRPADTTAYAVNDAISDSTSTPTTLTIASAAKASGGSGIITDITALSNNDPATALQGEIFIFDASVTSANDNAAFAISDADAKKCIAKIPFILEDIGSNDFYHAQGLNIGFTCVGSADLRFLVRAKNAYTPANAELFTFRFKISAADLMYRRRTVRLPTRERSPSSVLFGASGVSGTDANSYSFASLAVAGAPDNHRNLYAWIFSSIANTTPAQTEPTAC